MRWVYSAAALAIAGALFVGIFVDINFRVWANVALIAISVLVTIFTGLYLLRSKWWANAIGEVYLRKSIIVWAVLVQITVANWLDNDFWGRQSIRFIIFAAGAVVYVPMIESLWREQQNDRGIPATVVPSLRRWLRRVWSRTTARRRR
jgi:hypothetical protein